MEIFRRTTVAIDPTTVWAIYCHISNVSHIQINSAQTKKNQWYDMALRVLILLYKKVAWLCPESDSQVLD